MNTQERAITELILANPIPTDAEFDLVEIAADEYLTAIAQTGEQVPYLRHLDLATGWSRPSLRALAAFVVVLLLGAAALWANPTQSQPIFAAKDTLVGTWEFPFQKTATEMEFLTDNSYTTFKHGKIIDEGTYELNEGVLELHSNGQCASPGAPSTEYPPDGSYLVAMEGNDSATFSMINDQCPRYRDLDGVTLQRSTN